MIQIETANLAEIDEFPFNPRRGIYRDMDRLRADLEANKQKTPLDVWRDPTTGRVQVLQGNRRRACMLALGWETCEIRRHDFTDAGKALEWLLSIQEQTDAFDPVEKAMGVRDLLQLGVGMDAACAAVGRSAETVQLWLMLWDMPTKVQEAVKAEAVSLETVKVLAEVEGRETQAEALQMILAGPDGQPMGGGMARRAIEHAFLIPAKHRKAWEGMRGKLKRKFPADEGYTLVEWDRREDYVMGPTGHPQDRHEWADVPLKKSNLAEVVTWEDAAKRLGAPIFLAPAGEHKNGFVVVVNTAMIETADAKGGGAIFGRKLEARVKGGRMVETVRQAAQEGGQPPEMEDGRSEVGEDAGGMVPVAEEGGQPPEMEDGRSEMGQAWGEHETDKEARATMARVYDALTLDKMKNLTGKVWEPLMPYVLRGVNGNPLMMDFTGGKTPLGAWEEDRAARSEMRWALMAALCGALCAGDMEAVDAVEDALGVKAEG